MSVSGVGVAGRVPVGSAGSQDVIGPHSESGNEGDFSSQVSLALLSATALLATSQAQPALPHWSPAAGDSVAPGEDGEWQPRKLASLNEKLAAPSMIDRVLEHGQEQRMERRLTQAVHVKQSAAADVAQEAASAGPMHQSAPAPAEKGMLQPANASPERQSEAFADESGASGFESARQRSQGQAQGRLPCDAAQRGDALTATSDSRQTSSYRAASHVQTQVAPAVPVPSGGNPASQGPQAAAGEGPVSSVQRVVATAQPEGRSESRQAAVTQHVAEAISSRKVSAQRAAAGSAQPAEDAGVHPQEVRIEQLMRVVRAQILRGENRAQLRLNPDELGPLTVNLRWQESAVRVQIETQSNAARELLMKDCDALRESLQQAGLSVQRIEVVAGGESQQQPDGAASGWTAGSHEQSASSGGRPHTARSSTEDHTGRSHEPGQDNPAIRHGWTSGVLNLMA